MSEAAKIWLLLRRGILPQEHEAEVAEYVQSRVQDLALEIAGRFQVTEREAEQKIKGEPMSVCQVCQHEMTTADSCASR